MIEQVIAELNKIRCTEYEGVNADALRDMDLDNIESMLREIQAKEEASDDWADNVKDDAKDLEKEFEVLVDSLDNLRDAIGNLKRHF